MSEAEAVHKSDKLHAMSKAWLKRVQQRVDDRKKSWYASAERAEAAYAMQDGSGDVPDFNILFSNTETIVPAVFNSAPVPDIRERHRQGDNPARQVADMLERVVSVQVDDNALDVEMEDVVRDGVVPCRGVLRLRFDADTDEAGNVRNERVLYEAVSWRDYVEGKASRFSQVPWVAYRHRLSKEEAERVTDKEVYERQQVEGEDDERKEREDVWEVWDKRKKEVIFLRDRDGRILNIKPDPLGLKGFFPSPKPLQPVTLTGKRDPVVIYDIYRNLANELDQVTRRINAITRGLKVRGLIITGADDVEKLAEAGDNELVTASGLESLGTLGLEKAVLWWPIDTAIAVLRELYASREQTKQSIYEITGISDIVRGASDSRETATAQQVKSQWGSLRVKRLQSMIERMIRDVFVMTVELIASKFSMETLQLQSGMQIDEQAMQLLQDPLMHYRIDVESDSTVRGDLTRQKNEMSEFLQGTAQYFQVMQPVVAASPKIAGPVVALYASFSRQFNLGRQAEEALDELVQLAQQVAQNPQEQEGDKAAAADAQAKMQELQLKAQELQLRTQETQARLGSDQQKAQADLQLKQADLQLKAQDRQLKGLEIQLKERELGLKGREQDREDFKAEVDARAKAEEIQIEKDQQRGAQIGNG